MEGILVLALVFAVLIFSLIAWCILSTCMGAQLLAPIREWWDALVLSYSDAGRGRGDGYLSGLQVRRRMQMGREFGDGELFEMDQYSDRDRMF